MTAETAPIRSQQGLVEAAGDTARRRRGWVGVLWDHRSEDVYFCRKTAAEK
jgi:hypothetical protein